MTAGKRKIMFLLFILIFVVAASLAIIYAQGYRIQLNWPLKLNETLQKTGMLVLETNPKEARIYINNTFSSYLSNKLTSQADEEYTQTPAKIKYLLPGEYKITVEKEGYWTWEKKITIKPGKQTRLENIRLFKKTLPRRIVKAPLQNIRLSPDKKWAILKKERKLLNLTEETTRHLPKQKDENSHKDEEYEISWSPDSHFFVIENRLYKIDDPTFFINFEKESSGKVDNIEWQDNSTLRYQTNKNILKEFNVNSGNNRIILTAKDEIIAHTTRSDYTHIVAGNEKEVKYQIFSSKKSNPVREIKIPYSADYKFINKDHSLVNLYDKRNNSLYLVEPHALFDPIRHHLQGVKYTEWKDDYNLLYANDFEIWNYNINNGVQNLITRISRPIVGINKPFEEEYIIFYTDKNINIIEKRENNTGHTTEILRLNNIRSPGFDKNENVIYFNADIKGETGVYKLQI